MTDKTQSGSREKPILFSAPMVRAILAGEKTQTRRKVKLAGFGPSDEPGYDFSFTRRNGWTHHHTMWSLAEAAAPVRPGDTLWVKETWRVGGLRDPVRPSYEDRGDVEGAPGLIAVDYAASPELVRTPWCVPAPEVFQRLRDQALERAGRANVTSWGHGESPDKWRPSIYMPRWASRISLRVTDVRVERLGAISGDDALAEGAIHWAAEEKLLGLPLTPWWAFVALWGAVHGEGAWDRDEDKWVWVYVFERVEVPR